MLNKENLGEKKWATLQFAPLWVFNIVAGADGKVDKKEQNQFLEIIKHAVRFTNPLVHNILQSISEEFEDLLAKYEEDSREPYVGLADAINLVNEKDPENANVFKMYMFVIGFKIATASGGFLGMGDKMSFEEREVLHKIADVMNLSQKDLKNALTIAMDANALDIAAFYERWQEESKG